jgi:hypothetical protein
MVNQKSALQAAAAHDAFLAKVTIQNLIIDWIKNRSNRQRWILYKDHARYKRKRETSSLALCETIQI